MELSMKANYISCVYPLSIAAIVVKHTWSKMGFRMNRTTDLWGIVSFLKPVQVLNSSTNLWNSAISRAFCNYKVFNLACGDVSLHTKQAYSVLESQRPPVQLAGGVNSRKRSGVTLVSRNPLKEYISLHLESTPAHGEGQSDQWQVIVWAVGEIAPGRLRETTWRLWSPAETGQVVVLMKGPSFILSGWKGQLSLLI